MTDTPINTIWCFLGSVSSKDFEDHYNRTRIDQLEEALRLQGILPAIRTGMYGNVQRNFVAAIIRFADENEPCKVNTRYSQDWVKQGYSSTYVDYLDAMAQADLISYNRATKTIRPKASLKALAKLENPLSKVIAA